MVAPPPYFPSKPLVGELYNRTTVFFKHSMPYGSIPKTLPCGHKPSLTCFQTKLIVPINPSSFSLFFPSIYCLPMPHACNITSLCHF
mmetsp:Transcript_57961/g.103497  ORF Transcript_57961/g.103497 Transcript_57961/m.103497 type:complete len:87 (-) Transcript_57961:924-1184(-)